jgi:predicted ester cyclase
MDDPRAVAMRWQDAYSEHDEQALRSVLADDARLVGPNGVFSGRQAIGDYMMAWSDAFPDSRYTQEHVTVDGDTVVVESTFIGTQSGTLVDPSGDIPPSNRRVEARSAHAVVVSGGRVTEVRMYFDVFGFLSQLGVIPAAASTG